MKISENHKESGFTHINDERTKLIQLKHKFINVGETIAQVKQSTSAKITEIGTILVCQFKQEISSRNNEVFYFSNDVAFFEGTIDNVKLIFEDVDFEKLKTLKKLPNQNTTPPLIWINSNYYDSEEHQGKTITWEEWANNTETSLENLEPNLKEEKFSEGIEDVVLLASGRYNKPKKSKLSKIFQKIFQKIFK